MHLRGSHRIIDVYSETFSLTKVSSSVKLEPVKLEVVVMMFANSGYIFIARLHVRAVIPPANGMFVRSI